MTNLEDIKPGDYIKFSGVAYVRSKKYGTLELRDVKNIRYITESILGTALKIEKVDKPVLVNSVLSSNDSEPYINGTVVRRTFDGAIFTKSDNKWQTVGTTLTFRWTEVLIHGNSQVQVLFVPDE